MHPLGCFGSSLAFAPQTSVCTGCPARVDCETMVEARRPQMLRLLSHYSDPKGERMAVHWLKPDEKRRLKASRKAAALAEAETEIYGDRLAVTAMKATLDHRAHGLLDQMTLARINPRVCSFEIIGGVSGAMRAVIALLSNRPRTMSELSATLAQRSGYSAQTAQREAYALASILTSCDRAQRVGPHLELK
jgi:hypothetical protein